MAECGTESQYTQGCRCDDCREAKTVASAARRRRNRDRETPADKHGTESGYQYWGCRCGACRSAMSDLVNRRRAGRREHGTYSMYRRGGCRCELCTAANRERNREYSARRRAGLVKRKPKPVGPLCACGHGAFVHDDWRVGEGLFEGCELCGCVLTFGQVAA